tara:strand:- start:47 stop:223 length:177 start_codon:yes stop_codon:yes gene_type:complete
MNILQLKFHDCLRRASFVQDASRRCYAKREQRRRRKKRRRILLRNWKESESVKHNNTK